MVKGGVNSCVVAAKGLGTQNKLFKEALVPFKNTKFTKAGRAATKHPEYFGFKNTEEFREIYNTEEKINKLAAGTLKEIIRGGKVTSGTGGRYPNGWKTITLPDGRAASWHSDGTFIGFRGVR
jgi:filamentous hemagglutinin